LRRQALAQGLSLSQPVLDDLDRLAEQLQLATRSQALSQ